MITETDDVVCVGPDRTTRSVCVRALTRRKHRIGVGPG
jgi:hypothetical protein